MTSSWVPARCLAVLAGVLAAVVVVGRLVRPDVTAAAAAVRDGSWAAQPFGVLLVWLSAAAALGCVLWLGACAVATCVEALRGRAPARIPGCPATLRRAVLLACGMGLVAGATAPAHADPALTGWGGAVGDQVGIAGLPLPDRAEGGPGPTDRAALAPGPPGRSPAATTVPPGPPTRTAAVPTRPRPGRDGPAGDRAAGPGRVTVRPGDTLWSIAAATLPATADDADVDRRWRRIHAENAGAIGDDPHLISPGTVLRLPRG